MSKVFFIYFIYIFFLMVSFLNSTEIVYINSTKRDTEKRKNSGGVDIIIRDKNSSRELIKKERDNSDDVKEIVILQRAKKRDSPAMSIEIDRRESRPHKKVKDVDVDREESSKIAKRRDSPAMSIEIDRRESRLHKKVKDVRKVKAIQKSVKRGRYSSCPNSRVVKKGVFKRGRKPVVVIIIDDISNRSQIRKVQSLPFKITPSIFPPSNMSATTPKLTRGLNGHFMVHLPLQSKSKKMNRFRKTLMSYDSKDRIRGRVREIRRLFPTAKFINNHTGSTFTSNYRASKILYRELLKNGFIFVDSKTTGKTEIKRISREFNRPYIYRDIFLDNRKSVSYTLSQLKRGVNIAYRKGYSIIIGHPHHTTIRALRMAKKILKRVNVLYIDEFYRWRYGRRSTTLP